MLALQYDSDAIRTGGGYFYNPGGAKLLFDTRTRDELFGILNAEYESLPLTTAGDTILPASRKLHSSASNDEAQWRSPRKFDGVDDLQQKWQTFKDETSWGSSRMDYMPARPEHARPTRSIRRPAFAHARLL